MERDTTTKPDQYYLRIAKTRDQALQLRLKVQHSHGKIKHCMRHFDQSRDAFMAAIRDTGALRDLQFESLKLLEDQLIMDSEALKEAVEELRAVHYDLSSLDFDLFCEEQKQHGAQNFLDRLLDSGQVAPSTIESMTVAPNAAAEESRFHPLLEEYFDALGDRSLLRERLELELPQEHGEKRLQRERLVDQEKTPSQSESEFEVELEKERKDLEVELEQLNNRVAELFKACLDAGLDPDPSKYARQSDNGSTISKHEGKIEHWLGQMDDPGENSTGSIDEESWAGVGTQSSIAHGSFATFDARSNTLSDGEEHRQPLDIFHAHKSQGRRSNGELNHDFHFEDSADLNRSISP
ncbi:hypothetical protein AC578_7523 [Pseudocercospora eumusae]|uniref:Uncharacterized protein n=1 Tax=Pseudocercospora eumusae TaxID=321146 RepID=A0A139GWJ0_9PEZI|nr:hypothetical protein AC578_7523 [Pseudocercospora eumusae]